MFADSEALIEPARTVLEKCCALVRDRGLEVGIVLAGLQRLAFEKLNWLVQHRDVAGRLDIVCGGVGEPYPVV